MVADTLKNLVGAVASMDLVLVDVDAYKTPTDPPDPVAGVYQFLVNCIPDDVGNATA